MHCRKAIWGNIHQFLKDMHAHSDDTNCLHPSPSQNKNKRCGLYTYINNYNK